MREPLIRLAPVGYGFGPVGKALHIARAVRAVAGTAVRLELVAAPQFAVTAEPSLFDRHVTELGDERASAVVAVMNRNAAAAATDRGEPAVFVDSLAWLWDGPIFDGRTFVRYLYQSVPFLPVPAVNLAGLPRPRPVGPIVDAVTTSDTGRAGTVLSLAGLENFETAVDRGNVWYARVLLDALRSVAASRADLVRGTTVFGNPAALAWAGGVPPAVRVGSGRQHDFLRHASSSRLVVLPPGLTSLTELLGTGPVIALLPPQNYSQLLITRALRAEEPGIPALDWDSDVLDWLGGQRVPEKVGSQIVRNLVCERHLGDGVPPGDLAGLLDTGRQPVSPARARELVGEPTGAAEVATAVLELI